MSDNTRQYRSRQMLLDEPPLVVLPSLAVAIGLGQAIIVQQIHYWIAKKRMAGPNEEVDDKSDWVYNSYDEWKRQFPFFSTDHIRKMFNELERNGILVSNNFNNVKSNRTKWYTINYEKLNLTLEKKLGNDHSPGDREIAARPASGLDHPSVPYIQNGQIIRTISPDENTKMGKSSGDFNQAMRSNSPGHAVKFTGSSGDFNQAMRSNSPGHAVKLTASITTETTTETTQRLLQRLTQRKTPLARAHMTRIHPRAYVRASNTSQAKTFIHPHLRLRLRFRWMGGVTP